MLLQINEQLLLRESPREQKQIASLFGSLPIENTFRGALTHHFSATPKFSMIPCRYIIKESVNFMEQANNSRGCYCWI